MKHYFTAFFLVLFVANLRSQGKALLQGRVTNFSNKPLTGEIILFLDKKNNKTFRTTSDGQGTFTLFVPTGASYELKYKNFTTDMEYTTMDIPASPNATYNVHVQLEPPKDFILDNVYFDTGKSTLKPSSNKALNDLTEVLKLKSNMEIEIQGHTDNVGADESNIKLSQARAEAVKKYLVGKGVAAGRITAKGYGATMPIADNSSEEGRAKNRRTSLKVLKE